MKSWWLYYSTQYECYLLIKYTNIECFYIAVFVQFALDIRVTVWYDKIYYETESVNQVPIKYKMNLVTALKEAGYNSTVIRQEKIMGQRELQKLRHNELVSWATIETICKLLQCQPGDILEYTEENKEA